MRARAASPIFVPSSGDGLTDAYCRRLLAGLERSAGISCGGVHPRGLRHTHAAELRAEGVGVGIFSGHLGRRSVATTARHLDHVAS